tara:strand:- start:350 stop:586 length:237 start_codon:yes stop_codon:yes gene_type:complete
MTSKNPFEIRLETLKMAKEMLDQQLEFQNNLMYQMVDQTKEAGKDIKETLDKYTPDMYNPTKVIEKASEFYAYISKKD